MANISYKSRENTERGFNVKSVTFYASFWKKNCIAGVGETRVTQLNKHKIIPNVGKPKTTERGQKICEGVMITSQSFIPLSKDGSTVAGR